jgi:hypothetical protein
MLNRELVASALNTLPAQAGEIGSAADFVEAWTLLEFIKGKAKEMQEKMEAAGIEYMKTAGINEIVIGPEAKIILVKKKKEVFETNAIYAALNFTREQMEVLPLNPAWRKTAILANEKTAPAWSQDLYDDLEVRKINPVLLEKITGKK